MTDPRQFTDEELHAFIDGELDAAQAAAIQTALDENDILARRIALYRSDKERIAQVYAPLIHRPLPSAWLTKLDATPRRFAPMLQRRSVFAMAASVALAVVGATAYRVVSTNSDDDILNEAFAALNNTMPASATGSVEDVNQTLATELGLNLKAPDLSKMGYHLAGVNVYTNLPDSTGIKLDYRTTDNRTVALYVRKSMGAVRFDMLKRGTVRICVWQDDVVGTVMMGEMSAGEMLRLASLAYSGLNA